MFPDLLDSLTQPAAYRRFAGEKAARTAGYVAFLSLIFVGALAVALKLRLAPLFNETFSWLRTQMPAVQFAGGKVTSTAAGPLRLEHPRYKEIALMIDTGRAEPVTPQLMAETRVLAYLTNNALYLDRGGKVETLDLSKSSAERPVTVDAASYRDMERAFDWVFYPSILLFFFVVFAAALSFFGLLYALAGMLFSSLAGGTIGFGSLLRLAIHAQTAGALLRALDTALPRSIPYSGLLSAALSLTYLWLGVRQTAQTPPPPAPAP